MSLVLYNTLTRTSEVFHPQEEGHVRFYVCGPTVHDFAHLGNARAVVVFDLLDRVLRKQYPHVTHIRNITDVDDKILIAALNQGRSARDIARDAEDAFIVIWLLWELAPLISLPARLNIFPDMIAMISAC